jgi:hypothetical protein
MARAENAALKQALEQFLNAYEGGSNAGEVDHWSPSRPNRDTPGSRIAEAHTSADVAKHSRTRNLAALPDATRAAIDTARRLLTELAKVDAMGGVTPGQRSAVDGGGTFAAHAAASRARMRTGAA